VAAEESQAALKTQAKITLKKTTMTAFARIPNGRVKSTEHEKGNGMLVWSFDIAMPKPRNITEIQVDPRPVRLSTNRSRSLPTKP